MKKIVYVNMPTAPNVKTVETTDRIYINVSSPAWKVVGICG